MEEEVTIEMIEFDSESSSCVIFTKRLLYFVNMPKNVYDIAIINASYNHENSEQATFEYQVSFQIHLLHFLESSQTDQLGIDSSSLDSLGSQKHPNRVNLAVYSSYFIMVYEFNKKTDSLKKLKEYPLKGNEEVLKVLYVEVKYQKID